jgi:hypothetical protein
VYVFPGARKTRCGKKAQVPSPIWSTKPGTAAPDASVRVKVEGVRSFTGFEKKALTTTSVETADASAAG